MKYSKTHPKIGTHLDFWRKIAIGGGWYGLVVWIQNYNDNVSVKCVPVKTEREYDRFERRTWFKPENFEEGICCLCGKQIVGSQKSVRLVFGRYVHDFCLKQEKKV